MNTTDHALSLEEALATFWQDFYPVFPMRSCRLVSAFIGMKRNNYFQDEDLDDLHDDCVHAVGRRVVWYDDDAFGPFKAYQRLAAEYGDEWPLDAARACLRMQSVDVSLAAHCWNEHWKCYFRTKGYYRDRARNRAKHEAAFEARLVERAEEAEARWLAAGPRRFPEYRGAL